MTAMNEGHFAILRRHMVEVIGIHTDLMSDELGKEALDAGVMTAMLQVPRHLFVPDVLAHLAYQDMPLPIGFERRSPSPSSPPHDRSTRSRAARSSPRDRHRFGLPSDRVAWIRGAGAVTPTLSGFRRCGHNSGVPTPAYGSGYRQQWRPRSPGVGLCASAGHRRSPV
jgi:hypothetical protein